MFGTHPLVTNLHFAWALDNLFDKTWAPRVSKSDVLDHTPCKVTASLLHSYA
jgi:hypothetical protein